MEINKITFESLKSDEIINSFEELDVNADGKITEEDKTASTDSKITSQISALLNSTDEDAELSANELTKTGYAKGGNSDGKTSEQVVNEAMDFIAEMIAGEISDMESIEETGGFTSGGAAAASTSSVDTEKYNEINSQITTINTEIASIDDEIAALNDENKTSASLQKTLENEQKLAEEKLQEANNKLENEQILLNKYVEQYEAIQDEIKSVNDEILAEQNREQKSYQESVDSIVNKAINDYNPEEDGDNFDAYLAEKLDEGGYPVFSDLESLNGKANKLEENAVSVMRGITIQASVVQRAKVAVDIANTTLGNISAKLDDVTAKIQNNNEQIQSLENKKSCKKTEKVDLEKQIQTVSSNSGLSAKELLAKIPCAELALCKENNVDLTKCVVAMGDDGIFHVYMKENSKFAGYYMSVVRMYAEGQGFDSSKEPYIRSGNGYISPPSEAAEGSGRPVYTFTCINEDMTDGKVCESCGCYETYSPLSFDVDGDGINTTSETVSFDIDGDGELDTVNNSAEWVLAFDNDKDGISGEDGSELFGNNTDLDGDGKADGFKDGFEALKALAEQEGLIGNDDNVLDENDIALLSEKYGLTMTNGYGGEMKSLLDLGITEINLAKTDETILDKNFDGNNNDIMRQEGATFTIDGETREYADIWHSKKDNDAITDNNANNSQVKTSNHKEADTNIKDIKLELNKHGVVALKGEVDFASIKNSAGNNIDIPDEILNKVIEIEEDE